MDVTITRNATRCLSCGDVIESRHRRDFVRCKCRKLAVDGGRDYIKRTCPSGPAESWYEDLSEYETEGTK